MPWLRHRVADLLNTYTQFTDDINIIDSDMCQLKDIDTTSSRRTSSSTPGSKSSPNMKHMLTRYEFLEAVVRLALQKFVKGGSGSHHAGEGS